MVREHRLVAQSALCNSNTTQFLRIGIHIRLGDVAEKFDTAKRYVLRPVDEHTLGFICQSEHVIVLLICLCCNRAKRAAARNHGNWGGKYNSPQMHIEGLKLIWQEVDPRCTRVCSFSLVKCMQCRCQQISRRFSFGILPSCSCSLSRMGLAKAPRYSISSTT